MTGTECRAFGEALLSDIRKSPTAFHAADTLMKLFEEAGFQALSETERWKLQPGRGYYVSRNQSAVIAFRLPEKAEGVPGFQIIASHSDSPAMKIKEHPEYPLGNAYVRLNVEKYGGMLMAPWFDRPLSAAGRLMVEKDGGVRPVLVNIDRDLLVIPNLAIHMNREVNEGYKYNVQKDLLPLYRMCGEGVPFEQTAAEAAGEALGEAVEVSQIRGMDLFLYNRMPGSIWGPEDCFISAPRLDDMACAFGSAHGLAKAVSGSSVQVCAVFDNEEVGSGTQQGACGTFLYDTMLRISRALSMDEEDFRCAVAKSFMISADNAHALHPNYADKADPVNRPVLNGGIVVKYSANQKYTTDGFSAALMRELCRKAGVRTQDFTNRSDILGGSTLGNKSVAQVSLNSVDIGLPQLAMHSPYETAGTRDYVDLIRVSELYYNSRITFTPEGGFSVG